MKLVFILVSCKLTMKISILKKETERGRENIIFHILYLKIEGTKITQANLYDYLLIHIYH